MNALSHIVVPSRELIRRTIDTEVAYTVSRLQVLERIIGNPVGIAYRRVGKNGWALMARHLPVPSFNAVVGLEPEDEGELESMLRWYRESGVRPQVEIVPGHESESLLRELVRLGCSQARFHASLIARPECATPPDPSVAVERVADSVVLEEFLDAYIAGWGIPDGAGFKRNVRSWLGQPDWSLFLGRVERQPASAAVLYVREGFGYLADAATDPKFRGKGLQSALLAHRMRAAAHAGAEYVSSGATFLSTSHRNMVRAGMTLQFVRAIWTPLESSQRGG